jgi:hypothetical protein
VGGGLTVGLREHLAAVREGDLRVEAERDRRLTEVAVEREKALKIKETADLAALDLAREIQTYKDEQANRLREQINSERGLYASKDDLASIAKELSAMIKPALDFAATQQGSASGRRDSRDYLLGIAGLVILALGLYLANR